jgi:exodeoxyribonuclease VII small subunit
MAESYEESLKKIEDIVDKLESGDLSIEDSITCYENGLKLLQKCYDKLNKAEKKLEELTKGVDSLSVKKTKLD